VALTAWVYWPACISHANYGRIWDGMSREQVEGTYKNRFSADKIKNVPLDGSPTKGADNAPVTIVEFADFQCPHCGEMAPHLDKFVDSRKQDVRFAYKFYVLGKFPNSENAARAAIAAGKQGKFWEMHHLIYANQQKLDQQGLDEMAKQLGLNVERLHADMQLPETQERITKDHKAGEDLKIEGTPTIYINGRQYDGRQEFSDWVDLELSMMGKPAATPGSAAPSSAPVVSGSASAKPAPSASAAPRK